MPSLDVRIQDNDAGLFLVRKTQARTNPERHFHPHWELLYIISGNRTFFHGSRTFRIAAGDLLFVRPGVLHRALNRPNEVCDLVTLSFTNPELGLFQALLPVLEACSRDESPILSVREVDRFKLTKTFMDMARELTARQTAYIPLVWSQLTLSLIELLREGLRIQRPSGEAPMNRTITAVIDYLGAFYREPLSLSSVADHFGLSTTYLSHAFRRETHFTFIEYLNSLRIREACRLLSCTHDHIIDIAQATGFGSVTQFGRCFRAVTGEAPRNWRNRNAKSSIYT